MLRGPVIRELIVHIRRPRPAHCGADPPTAARLRFSSPTWWALVDSVPANSTQKFSLLLGLLERLLGGLIGTLLGTLLTEANKASIVPCSLKLL